MKGIENINNNDQISLLDKANQELENLSDEEIKTFSLENTYAETEKYLQRGLLTKDINPPTETINNIAKKEMFEGKVFLKYPRLKKIKQQLYFDWHSNIDNIQIFYKIYQICLIHSSKIKKYSKIGQKYFLEYIINTQIKNLY